MLKIIFGRGAPTPVPPLGALPQDPAGDRWGPPAFQDWSFGPVNTPGYYVSDIFYKF